MRGLGVRRSTSSVSMTDTIILGPLQLTIFMLVSLAREIMAPSTATPSNLHRAPVACLKCRTAKVRCLLSRQSDRCDRCITNDTQCVFNQPKRARGRSHPYTRNASRLPSQDLVQEHSSTQSPSPSASATSPATPYSNSLRPHSFLPASERRPRPDNIQQPRITDEIRARIVHTLATLKGKRGAPFSFITSGDRPHSGGADSQQLPIQQNSQQQCSQTSHSTPSSLKLSWLLRPLRVENDASTSQAGPENSLPVKMPSYISSMSLGQTVTDPIEDGILTISASTALFQHFMLEMNAKWEYVLDPYVDTHDDVRKRSQLLFATVLFCVSKFASCADGSVSSVPDPFLQRRLCSLARNLVMRTIAIGDRSIETMLAFYLLVCWKDPDDDTSYLHSGYAFRILHDMDLEQGAGNGRQTARLRRAWLALFRQDKQQSLFFMRRSSLGACDEDSLFPAGLDKWLEFPHMTPLDFVSCCSADIRRIQSKLQSMVRKASSPMLSCILELMDSELNRWRSFWQSHFERESPLQPEGNPTIDSRELCPEKSHMIRLMGLWEHSVKLNIASAVLRQSLMALVTSQVGSDAQFSRSSVGMGLAGSGLATCSDVVGLNSSIEGACGTLRHLIMFPVDDLRRSPDAVLLLGPHAALFLCLLLCLPGNGLLGPAFQKMAVDLIDEVTLHVGKTVKSPHDTITLHYKYLESIVALLSPEVPNWQAEPYGSTQITALDLPQLRVDKPDDLYLDETTLQAAQVLAGGMNSLNCTFNENDNVFCLAGEPEQSLHVQSLNNLLDTGFFWDMSQGMMDTNTGV